MTNEEIERKLYGTIPVFTSNRRQLIRIIEEDIPECSFKEELKKLVYVKLPDYLIKIENIVEANPKENFNKIDNLIFVINLIKKIRDLLTSGSFKEKIVGDMFCDSFTSIFSIKEMWEIMQIFGFEKKFENKIKETFEESLYEIIMDGRPHLTDEDELECIEQ